MHSYQIYSLQQVVKIQTSTTHHIHNLSTNKFTIILLKQHYTIKTRNNNPQIKDYKQLLERDTTSSIYQNELPNENLKLVPETNYT